MQVNNTLYKNRISTVDNKTRILGAKSSNLNDLCNRANEGKHVVGPFSPSRHKNMAGISRHHTQGANFFLGECNNYHKISEIFI